MADDKHRKRMIVEEVGSKSEVLETPKNEIESEKEDINTKPVEEIKEKVEELQTITEHMGDDVEKSAEVQEDIAKAAEEVAPQISQSESQTVSSEPYMSPKQNSGPNPLIIIVPGIFLLGALLGGIWFYQKGIVNKASATPSPVSSTLPDASPSSSPSATLDLTKYPINIQNGSGIPGSASSAKDLLTQGGFSVSGTGNADSFDFTSTIVETKSDVPQAFIDKLNKTLSSVYVLGDAKSLPDSSTDEVMVIIGSSKAQ